MVTESKIKNKGYSLVEMIVVLAIIGIVSAMSVVSITMIHSAKAKDAAVVFDAEVAELIAKSKGQSDSNSDIFAFKIYKDGETYYLQHGTVVCSGAGSYTFTADSSDPISISKYVRVSFYPEGEAYNNAWDAGYDLGTTGQVLVFSKSGQCVSGAGNYGFFKRNGNLVARTVVRKNGSHTSR